MISRIRQKFKYGLTTKYLLDRLSSIGLGFQPFYLVLEGAHAEPLEIKPGISPIEERFLTMEEIKRISQHPEVGYTWQDFKQRIDRGCRCFGLLHCSEVAAYMWCNFSRCESYISFPLKKGEVYLFDAVCFNRYRGKNLAPYLRMRLYQCLKTQNFNTFYSITDRFNTPAVKFKKKLRAVNLKLFLYIRILTYRHAFLFKTYSPVGLKSRGYLQQREDL